MAKELLVPTFSKKDIELIVKEILAKEGGSSGGGLKLYSHEISIMGETSFNTEYYEDFVTPLRIVSTSSEPIEINLESDDYTWYTGIDGIITIVDDAGNIFGCMSYYDSTGEGDYVLDLWTGVANSLVQFTNVTQFEDYVTEF